jgi:hypothetical protein
MILNRLETLVGFSQITYLLSTIDADWPETFTSLSRFLGTLYLDVSFLEHEKSTSAKVGYLCVIASLVVIPLFVLLRVWVIKDYDNSIEKEFRGGMRKFLRYYADMVEYFYETVTLALDFDGEGEQFWWRIAVATTFVVITTAVVGGSLVLPVFVYSEGPWYYQYCSAAAIVIFLFVPCVVFMGLVGDPTIAFKRAGEKIKHEKRMKNVYEGGGKLSITQVCAAPRSVGCRPCLVGVRATI